MKMIALINTARSTRESNHNCIKQKTALFVKFVFKTENIRLEYRSIHIRAYVCIHRQNSQQTASLIRNTVGLVSTTCMNNIRKGMSKRERERERENVFGSYMLYVVRIRYFYILSFYHSCPIRFLIFPCFSCMAESSLEVDGENISGLYFCHLLCSMMHLICFHFFLFLFYCILKHYFRNVKINRCKF